VSKTVARRIFEHTLAAIDIPSAVQRALAREGARVYPCGIEINLNDYREIVAIAFGKASLAMAEGLHGMLAPDYAIDGIVVAPISPASSPPGWKTFLASHPVPDEGSFAAGRAILDRLAKCDESSLVLFLISGGGSALVEQPLDARATLDDFRALHSVLVTCGASIEEINVIRKHLSATKGGRLATAAPGSMKITLAVSDVPPGEESALASGPTLPDPSTIEDAQRIARTYGLLERFPTAIRNTFKMHTLQETPKANDPAFVHSHFEKILGEHELLHAAHHACESAGYLCICDNTTNDWPLAAAAAHLLELLKTQKGENPGRRVAVLSGGELSSPVTGNGTGGRNSAFVLECVPKIAGKPIAVLSAGTDGIDGNSPAAGAVADGESMSRAAAMKLDCAEFAARSDAYGFFAALGDAIVTGPTGNNLRDLRILLHE
jgi:hydroxypyruvate reductase